MKATLTKNDVTTISAETNADARTRRTVLTPMIQELQMALATEGTHVLTIVVTKEEAEAEAEAAAKMAQAMNDRRAALAQLPQQPRIAAK